MPGGRRAPCTRLLGSVTVLRTQEWSFEPLYLSTGASSASGLFPRSRGAPVRRGRREARRSPLEPAFLDTELVNLCDDRRSPRGPVDSVSFQNACRTGTHDEGMDLFPARSGLDGWNRSREGRLHADAGNTRDRDDREDRPEPGSRRGRGHDYLGIGSLRTRKEGRNVLGPAAQDLPGHSGRLPTGPDPLEGNHPAVPLQKSHPRTGSKRAAVAAFGARAGKSLRPFRGRSNDKSGPADPARL